MPYSINNSYKFPEQSKWNTFFTYASVPARVLFHDAKKITIKNGEIEEHAYTFKDKAICLLFFPLTLLSYAAILGKKFTEEPILIEKKITAISSNSASDHSPGNTAAVNDIFNQKINTQPGRSPASDNVDSNIATATIPSPTAMSPVAQPLTVVTKAKLRVPLAQRPGINNQNNNCFLISNMHLIAHIDDFKKAFSPTHNTLKQRPNETKNDFNDRLQIQKYGKSLIKKILSGNGNGKISDADFQKFKVMLCDAENIFHGIGKAGGGDTSKVLAELMDYLDYPMPQLYFNRRFEDVAKTLVTSGLNLKVVTAEGMMRDATFAELAASNRGIDIPLDQRTFEAITTQNSLSYLFVHDDDVKKINPGHFFAERQVQEYPSVLIEQANGKPAFETTERKIHMAVDTQKLPAILIISGLTGDKLKDKFSMPHTIQPPGSSSEYELTAILHYGEGHGTVTLREADQWVHFDDSVVDSKNAQQKNKLHFAQTYFYMLKPSALTA